MNRWWRAWWLTMALWSQVSLAIDEGVAFEDAARQQRYLTLVHELRCVVCQNQSIADSNADLAADLRKQVRGLIAAGQSDEQIKHYLTDRYGDYILYDPPWSAQSALLWVAPLALLAGSAVILRRVLRAQRRDLERGDSV
jgi:cytochrome c-type biogenesis protein CcmH